MWGQVDNVRELGTVALLLSGDDSTLGVLSSSLLPAFSAEACCSFTTPVKSVKASLESVAATSFYRSRGGPDKWGMRRQNGTHSFSEIIFALGILEFIF